jgi:hypothetical protein
MTIAELKKALEKYNDTDVVVKRVSSTDGWSGWTFTHYHLADSSEFEYDGLEIMSAEEWEKVKEN